MASAKQTSTSASSNEPLIVNLNIDEFSAGLPTDFDGVITKARFTVWNYDHGMNPETGQEYDYFVTACLWITPDESSGFDPIKQHYRAADLKHFAPLTADKKFVDLDNWDGKDEEKVEGVMLGVVGDKPRMPNKASNFAHVLESLAKCGFEERSADIRYLEGLRCHFDQLGQKERKGLSGGSGKGGKTILLPTMVHGRVKVDTPAATKPNGAAAGDSPSTSTTSTTAPATSTTPDASGNPLVPILIDFIASAIPKHGKPNATTGDVELAAGDLQGIIMSEGPRGDNGKQHILLLKLAKTLTDQAKAGKGAGNSPFETTQKFVFDSDSEAFSLI